MICRFSNFKRGIYISKPGKSPMERVNWGILGAAKINGRLIPAIQNADNAQLVGLASRSVERGQQMTQEYGIPVLYESYEKLLDNQEISAVYLPLPNHLHKEWVFKIAGSGKHILCEKPFALSHAEAEEMFDICQKHGVKVMEAFMYRFNPITQKIKSLIDKGTIGEVGSIQFTFAHPLINYLRGNDNYRYYAKFGGGALLDLSVYGINFCNYILGQPSESVLSSIGIRPSEKSADMTSEIIIKYPKDVICSINSSFSYHGRKVIISGSEGSIEVSNLVSMDENHIDVHNVDQGVSTIETSAFDHYRAQVEHFSQCIIDDSIPQISQNDTLNVMKIVDESFQKMKWI